MSFTQIIIGADMFMSVSFPVSVLHRRNTSYLSNNKEHVHVNTTYIMFFISLFEYQGNHLHSFQKFNYALEKPLLNKSDKF